MKVCTSCLVEKPLDAFGPDRTGAQGRMSKCRSCRNELAREQRRTDPEVRLREKFAVLKSLYNITREQYDALIEQQAGRCAICNEAQRDRLCVDHDHRCCPGPRSCGRCVRGLLCQRCNLMLAFVENANLMASTDAYLSRYSILEPA